MVMGTIGAVLLAVVAFEDAAKIKSSKWSVGCETMYRDYADRDSFKALLPGLGVKHARSVMEFTKRGTRNESIQG